MNDLINWLLKFYSRIDPLDAVIGRNRHLNSAAVRAAMRDCIEDAIADSAKYQHGDAGDWGRLVLCGDAPDEGSLLASVISRYEGQALNAATICTVGGQAFHRATATVVGTGADIHAVHSTASLRAALLRMGVGQRKPRATVCIQIGGGRSVARVVEVMVEVAATHTCTPTGVVFTHTGDLVASDAVEWSGLRCRRRPIAEGVDALMVYSRRAGSE